jgi:hypothetical protein
MINPRITIEEGGKKSKQNLSSAKYFHIQPKDQTELPFSTSE